MPTEHLALPTDQLTARVEAVLRGAAVNDDELSDAVETYRTAGRAAQQQRQERACFQAHIRPVTGSPSR